MFGLLNPLLTVINTVIKDTQILPWRKGTKSLEKDERITLIIPLKNMFP